MRDSLFVIGSLFIIMGWMIQLYYSLRKKIFALSLKFVALYVIGVIVLIIDALEAGEIVQLILNLIIGLIAILAGFFAKKARP